MSLADLTERSKLDAKLLLAQLQGMRARLELDLRERAGTVPEVQERLQAEYEAALKAKRTGEAFGTWCEDAHTQAAVAWILAGVFIRFLEDNGLIDPMLSGPGERRQRAIDREDLHFNRRPTDSYRDYLLGVFSEVGRLPAAERLFDPRHNSIWAYGISGDAAKELIQFWRRRDPDTNSLIHDFTDPGWDTRFLGDLYQDLSEAARKRYALLQTPEFVEEFVLDRTLDPAVEEFGLSGVRMIDPTCGSGHFLLAAFRRLVGRWFNQQPGTPERELVQKALDAANGVDLNPYAVAIARFRLMIAALKSSRITRLTDAPGYRINVAAGDSLLHGARSGQLDVGGDIRHAKDRGLDHAYFAEDLDDVYLILGRRYHCVVGNPPYITVKDKALNQAYRDRYATCHMKYSLGVPFTERFFDLALDSGSGAGYVGMITADSFMKREFGKRLIEEFLPHKDLTHVISSLGAYIPGHGTPTVILFGRNREPVGQMVRTVMARKSEPQAPADPAKGKVWLSILDLVDRPGTEDEFRTVADLPRDGFRKHPWSIGGGGSVGLKASIEEGRPPLSASAVSIGITSFTLEDEVYLVPPDKARRLGLRDNLTRPIVLGDEIRDWTLERQASLAVFPYRSDFSPVASLELPCLLHMWPYRSNLAGNLLFGSQKKVDAGLLWYEFGRLTYSKLQMPLSLACAEVATHNHFVLDRGGKVFKQTAPVVKLPPGATVEDHIGLLGLLNSSTACFWLKQVCFPKGGSGMERGIQSEAWMERYAHNSNSVGDFPLVKPTPLDLASQLDVLGQRLAALQPGQIVAAGTPTRARLAEAKAEAKAIRKRMIALQEELDWRCYQLYGLLPEPIEHADPPPFELGQRAFEIVMARQMAAGELQTTWFERHGSMPITEIPVHWPAGYRAVVERRIQLIESEPYVNLVERPEYKRRWAGPSWEQLEKEALRDWLLDRLEASTYWPDTRLRSTRGLANQAQTDADFLQVAELYVGQPGFDLNALVAELVAGVAVPSLPCLRYKESGLRKRAIWKETWNKQRQEDAIDAEVERELSAREGESEEAFKRRVAAEQKKRKQERIGDIPPPPKYQQADFASQASWRMRGPLDVPKERFISYPACSREGDASLVVGWAGWDQLEQARAIASWYTEVGESDGWSAERRKPLLAGLHELLPWLKQWHNDLDPEYGERMGDFFETYLNGQLQALTLTLDDLRSWQPPASSRKRDRTR